MIVQYSDLKGAANKNPLANIITKIGSKIQMIIMTTASQYCDGDCSQYYKLLDRF